MWQLREMHSDAIIGPIQDREEAVQTAKHLTPGAKVGHIGLRLAVFNIVETTDIAGYWIEPAAIPGPYV